MKCVLWLMYVHLEEFQLMPVCRIYKHTYQNVTVGGHMVGNKGLFLHPARRGTSRNLCRTKLDRKQMKYVLWLMYVPLEGFRFMPVRRIYKHTNQNVTVGGQTVIQRPHKCVQESNESAFLCVYMCVRKGYVK